MASYDMDEGRDQVRRILDRAHTDPEYARLLRENPREVLGQAGFAEPVLEDLTNELGLAGEMGTASHAGHLPTATCVWTCNWLSCIATWCGCVPNTN